MDYAVDVFISVELRVGIGVGVELFEGGNQHVPAGLFVSASETTDFVHVRHERILRHCLLCYIVN